MIDTRLAVVDADKPLLLRHVEGSRPIRTDADAPLARLVAQKLYDALQDGAFEGRIQKEDRAIAVGDLPRIGVDEGGARQAQLTCTALRMRGIGRLELHADGSGLAHKRDETDHAPQSGA